MKSYLLALGAAFLLAMLGFSLALAAVGAAPHSVRGEGTVGESLPTSFAFDAGRSDGRVRGRATIAVAPFGRFEGKVRCLKVAGDRAALAGSLTASSLPGPTHFLIVVEDNGSVSAATPDEIFVELDDQRLTCGEVPIDAVLAPIKDGNIVVR